MKGNVHGETEAAHFRKNSECDEYRTPSFFY